MERKSGVLAWIRETSFLKFLIAWVAGIFIFTLVYWCFTLIGPGINMLSIDGNVLSFNLMGLIDALYASLLTATIFGFAKVVSAGFFRIFLYAQLAFSTIVLMILLDKLLQRYVFPHYHIHHGQEKKIHTMLLTMSIFRDHIDRLKSEFKSKGKKDVKIKEIEAIIDGLYVTFLDIDQMFGARNMHKHHITDRQYLMVIQNVEDSLQKLSKFIDFLNEHRIEWKDRSVEFWIRYILETADKITLHFDDVKIKNPHMIISIENIKEHTVSIEKKI